MDGDRYLESSYIAIAYFVEI